MRPSDPTKNQLVLRAGFLSAHPDLRYRLLGLDSMRESRYAEALRYFRRASFYGDKPSQGMVAEMLWDGRGIAQDRPSAYAWMDLAAEHGYPGFLGLREKYWSSLTAAERDHALQLGQAIYAEYGDAAAQPRIASVLRRQKMRVTGSRTGMAVGLQIVVAGPGARVGAGGITSAGDFGGTTIDGSKFYDPQFWDPKQYQAWHDAMWLQPRIGTVRVGEMQDADAVPAPSRVQKAAPASNARDATPPVPDTPEEPVPPPG